VQRFFSAPLSFSEKIMVKKSLIVWQVLQRVKALGLTPSNPAAQK
jgi:hypothetical protein